MSLISRMRRQYAWWWQRTGTDAFGRPTWAAGVKINCRWEDDAVEYVAPDGTRAVSKAVVYVDRDMKVGDVIELTTSSGILPLTLLDPLTRSGASRVKQFTNLPDLKAKNFLKTAYL